MVREQNGYRKTTALLMAAIAVVSITATAITTFYGVRSKVDAACVRMDEIQKDIEQINQDVNVFSSYVAIHSAEAAASRERITALEKHQSELDSTIRLQYQELVKRIERLDRYR